MTSILDLTLGSICFFIAVILTIRLHIFARKKLHSMIDTDHFFGGGPINLVILEAKKFESDFEVNSDDAD